MSQLFSPIHLLQEMGEIPVAKLNHFFYSKLLKVKRKKNKGSQYVASIILL